MQLRVYLACLVDPAAARMNRQVQVGDAVSLWSNTHEAWIPTRVVRIESHGVEVDGKRSIIPWGSERLHWPRRAPAEEAGAAGAAVAAGAETVVAAGGAAAANAESAIAAGGAAAAIADSAVAAGGAAVAIADSAVAAGGAALQVHSQPAAATRQRGSHESDWEARLKDELLLHGGVMGLLKDWKSAYSTPEQLTYLRQKIYSIFPMAADFQDSPFGSTPTSSTLKGLVHPPPPQ